MKSLREALIKKHTGFDGNLQSDKIKSITHKYSKDMAGFRIVFNEMCDFSNSSETIAYFFSAVSEQDMPIDSQALGKIANEFANIIIGIFKDLKMIKGDEKFEFLEDLRIGDYSSYFMRGIPVKSIKEVTDNIASWAESSLNQGLRLKATTFEGFDFNIYFNCNTSKLAWIRFQDKVNR